MRFAATGAACALLWAMPWSLAAADPPRDKASSSKHDTRSPRQLRAADAGVGRPVAGVPPGDDRLGGAETAELAALREAERDLFLPALPPPGSVWPAEPPLVGSPGGEHDPIIQASGLSQSRLTRDTKPEQIKDIAWLSRLQMPDIPVRWDERVVRYLEFFRDDPRGHATFANLFRHSGLWRAMAHKALRRKSLPEDLVWVSMLESGFDAAARSPAGAVGLWQFTAETAKLYGLTVDRWIDQRLDPRVETDAAVDLLDNLHTRFGSWEMALAGYDMGHAGLSSIVRRYNTNDFWTLSRTEGALPWETTLYVPKIVAAAVVANNLAAFGFGDLPVDIPAPTDEVSAPAATSLAAIAQAAGCSLKDLQGLNPELRAGRTPPSAEAAAYPVRVPQGKGAAAAQGLSRLHKDQPALERYVVRFGETLDQIASERNTTPQRLVDLNAILPGEGLRGGTVLLVPRTDATVPPAPSVPVRSGPANSKPAIVVPADIFIYPDRKRVFYRIRSGDTLSGISDALHVSPEDLDRWNDLDPSARLQEGMTMQAFVDPAADLSGVPLLPESDVSVLAVGSDEFFSALERDKGFRRVTVAARNGETLETIGRRFGVRPRTMERINRRGCDEALTAGQTVVVYVPSANGGPRNRSIASTEPAPNEWSPSAAALDLLP